MGRRAGETVTGDPKGLALELADRILKAPMLARRDAPAASGKFPLVLWGSRYGTTAAQAAPTWGSTTLWYRR